MPVRKGPRLDIGKLDSSSSSSDSPGLIPMRKKDSRPRVGTEGNLRLEPCIREVDEEEDEDTPTKCDTSYFLNSKSTWGFKAKDTI